MDIRTATFPTLPAPLRWFACGMLLLALTAALTSQANYGYGQKADIVDTAAGAGQFATLVAAVEAAGLVDTLRGDGPFTVFAPTDEAFAKLPEGTVEALLEEEKLDQLRAILTYHVVAGKVMAEDVASVDSATTVQGQSVSVSTMGNGVMIDGASVVQADIEASNGVIHVIDTVLIPN